MVRDITADFVLPRFKTVSYGKRSLRFLRPQLRSKLRKEETNIGILAAFRKMIRKKDVVYILGFLYMFYYS